MERYWSLIQEKVCRKCIDGDGKGNCRLPSTLSCALKESLPDIVRIAEQTRGASYEDSVKALRAGICSRCVHELDDGTCLLRNTLECALDRYYILVLDVIDEVRLGTFSNVQ